MSVLHVTLTHQSSADHHTSHDKIYTENTTNITLDLTIAEEFSLWIVAVPNKIWGLE
jgi:hypothetical protein